MKVDRDILVAHRDLLGYVLDDLSFLGGGQVVPVTVEVLSFGHDLVPRGVLNPQEIQLSLKSRKLVVHLPEALFEGLVCPAEPVRADLVADIELVDLIHLGVDLGSLAFEGGEEFLLVHDDLVGLFEVRGQLVRGQKKLVKLLPKDSLQILDRNLVPALRADVFRAVRGDIHLGPAVAERDAGEEMDGSPGRALPVLPALVEHGIALRPDVLRDDGLDGRQHPIGFGLERPVLLVAGALGVVGAAGALGGRVAQQTVDGRVSEL